MKSENKYIKYLFWVAVIAVVSFGTYYFKGMNPLSAAKEYFIPKMGEVTPKDQVPFLKPFTSFDSGKNVLLNDYKGKVMLINFWATWCGPCIVEKPSFHRLVEYFKEKEVKFFFVSHEDQEVIRRFNKERGNQLPTYSSHARDLGAFSGIQIPRTYIVSKSGEIVYGFVGGRTWDEADVIEMIEKELQKN